MPETPSSDKKNTRPSKKKRNTRGVKRDIKKAVNQLPDMLLHEAAAQEKKRRHNMLADLYTTDTSEQHRLAVPKAKDMRKRWLVSGVSVLSVAIFAIWVWNLRTMVYDAGQARAQSDPIWTGATEDFEQILNTLAPPESAETRGVSKNIKETIENALAAMIASSAATSTEVATSTTSTEGAFSLETEPAT